MTVAPKGLVTAVRHELRATGQQQPIYSVVRFRPHDLLQVCGDDLSRRDLGSRLIARSSLLRFVGDHTAGVPPVPIPNTEVKPRRADCTARESVWESRSLPALNKSQVEKLIWLFPF